MREAMLYERQGDGTVACRLCAHRCLIKDRKRGVCGVRENRGGTLYSLVYGAVVAENVDPIEKKPLFHLYPASRSYSIATVGCNFRCLFCQNADISQLPRERGEIVGRFTAPEVIVEGALRSQCRTISYTYTEPTVFFEYAYDVARLAVGKGLMNVFVTNGYMTAEALETIAPYLHAANVDLKSFRDDFYRSQCGARLEPVLSTLREMKKRGIWVEVTTLVIPGLNDSEGELREIAAFIADLGRETPWHVSRFHPRYRLRDREATPAETIYRAVAIGKEAGLKYVYSGNIPGGHGEDTFCSRCASPLISRYGFFVRETRLDGNRCLKCKTPLEGVF
ncbi:MAG TPA: AmmeMemoRadiSam system radical SAM enzyme [Syntrophales bacterium]|nr:AmmeMemoRadiSam system radical SAM enzyme [Syntrophales bacterium]HOM07127.1 AmmeMemoRadiSam system radical SAM enzyme [Syntrophales bacterium]HOO00358.1 AmmeMemoRadiSam system radical SAM enzyme [Syntrophales bacterium]HPC00429.1 AmmeMemoRadiSam system radical SAM enzyme [Syntrophales bacterium]HPQ05512.1 AmmeMemoRadiSam system radical SAM enzyme [Syntrophales bacterium]